MSVSFSYGALCDDLETQANEQGFTLGDKAEVLNQLRYYIIALWNAQILTDSQVDKAFVKLSWKVVDMLTRLEKKNG